VAVADDEPAVDQLVQGAPQAPPSAERGPPQRGEGGPVDRLAHEREQAVQPAGGAAERPVGHVPGGHQDQGVVAAHVLVRPGRHHPPEGVGQVADRPALAGDLVAEDAEGPRLAPAQLDQLVGRRVAAQVAGSGPAARGERGCGGGAHVDRLAGVRLAKRHQLRAVAQGAQPGSAGDDHAAPVGEGEERLDLRRVVGVVEHEQDPAALQRGPEPAGSRRQVVAPRRRRAVDPDPGGHRRQQAVGGHGPPAGAQVEVDLPAGEPVRVGVPDVVGGLHRAGRRADPPAPGHDHHRGVAERGGDAGHLPLAAGEAGGAGQVGDDARVLGRHGPPRLGRPLAEPGVDDGEHEQGAESDGHDGPGDEAGVVTGHVGDDVAGDAADRQHHRGDPRPVDRRGPPEPPHRIAPDTRPSTMRRRARTTRASGTIEATTAPAASGPRLNVNWSVCP
jgi:hypothetical protein